MIEMIAGVFGLPVKQDNGKTRVVAKGPESGPFNASPEQEARLVGLKLARYVTAPVEVDEDDAEVVDDTTPIGFDETPPVDSVEDDAEVEEIVDMETLSAKELREIGKEYGLTFKANAKKSDMIEAITAAQAETDDGEPAPEFDASEAVL